MPVPRVEELTAYEVVVPCHPGTINSPEYGSFLTHEWDLLPIVLLEGRTSDGLTILGEVGRGPSLADLAPWLKELPGTRLAGVAPELPERWKPQGIYGGVLAEVHPPAHFASPSPVWYAFEMMVYDWAGQRLGCRIVDLIGGSYRGAVPVDYWCGRQTPEHLREIVAKARSRGFNGLKMKSKLGDPVVEQVRAIRDAGGPTFSVTIDPMYQWFSPHDSLATLKALEEFGSGIRVEDPFPEDRPEFWRRARQTVSVPLIWHARGMASLRRALQENCADAFNCSGGFREFQLASHAVELAGYSCWRGSSLELGVGQVAGLHAAAASRCCVMPSDFQSGLIRPHTLIEWDWPYRYGTLTLPEGPGLGVTLDRDQVTHYCKAKETYRI